MTRRRSEHPDTRRWRELADLRLRQIHAFMWELGRVQMLVGDICAVSLNPPLRDGTAMARCVACGKEIADTARNGNHRVYCAKRCQQRAYRARRKLAHAA